MCGFRRIVILCCGLACMCAFVEGRQHGNASESKAAESTEAIVCFDGGSLSDAKDLRRHVERAVQGHADDGGHELTAEEYVSERMREFDQYRLLLVDTIRIHGPKGARRVEFAHQQFPHIIVYCKDGNPPPKDGDDADQNRKRDRMKVSVRVLTPVVFSATKKSLAAKITVETEKWRISGLREFDLLAGEGTKVAGL